MSRRSPKPALATALALAAAWALSPALAADPAEAPEPAATTLEPIPGYVPDPAATEAAPDGAWRFHDRGVSLSLVPLDDDARWDWLRERGIAVDPFAPRGDEGSRYATFSVELDNRSGGLLVFTPSKIWLQSGGAEIHRPLDLASMESAYRMHDREMPAAFAAAGDALLQGSTMLESGRRATGLLVFPTFKKSPKSFRVLIPLTTGMGDVIDFDAAYLSRERAERKRRKMERADAKAAKKAREEGEGNRG